MITDTLLPSLLPYVVMPQPGYVCRAIVLVAPLPIVSVPPPAIHLPPPASQPQSITVAAEKQIDVDWIEVYQFRLPGDPPGACYIADWNDVGCTLKKLVRSSQYTTLHIRLGRLPKWKYDEIAGPERESFADCG